MGEKVKLLHAIPLVTHAASSIGNISDWQSLVLDSKVSTEFSEFEQTESKWPSPSQSTNLYPGIWPWPHQLDDALGQLLSKDRNK